MKKVTAVPAPPVAVSCLKGLYERVACELEVEVRDIVRVAHGEENSKTVEKAIERELRKTLKRA